MSILVGFAAVALAAMPAAPAGARPFVTGYYALWQQEWLPLDKVAWANLTHLVPHRVGLRDPALAPDLDNPYRSILSGDVSIQIGGASYRGVEGLRRMAREAHAHGVRILLGFGGGQTEADWLRASQHQAQFAADVVAAAKDWGYDGLDIDWEPLSAASRPRMLRLVEGLRTASAKASLIGFQITVPLEGLNLNPGSMPSRQFWAFVTSLSRHVDQINPMSYCVNGPWGWHVWHNNALFGHTAEAPTDVAGTLEAYATRGRVPKGKLGVGVGFYAYAVGPGDGAGEVVLGAPYPEGANTNSNDNEVAYRFVASTWWGKAGMEEHWDDAAKASYLTFPLPGVRPSVLGHPVPGAFTWVSYESPRALREKGHWLRAQGYGGTMIWTLNEGTLPDFSQPALEALGAVLRR